MCGKAGVDHRGVEVLQRQEHRPPRARQLPDDAARDAIAGRQIAGRLVAGHERLAVGVHQPRALAAQRLGEQEARLPGDLQRRRMELHELEVGDARAGELRHRDAVAGGHLRVGRLAEHLAGAAGREQRGAGADRPWRAAGIEVADADGAAVLERDAGGAGVLDGVDARMRRRPAPRACRRWCGRSCRARGARGGRCAPPRAPARPRRSAGDRTRRPSPSARGRRPGPALDQDAHRVEIAEPVAGRQRVLQVQRGIVVVPTAAAMPPCA